MGSFPSDFDPVGSHDTAKAIMAQHASFLLSDLQACMDAAMHTIKEKLGKKSMLRPACAWGCLA
jgi:hypothetical protein